MPELTVMIGAKHFEVACQDGEEEFLHAAAAMLDAEASVLLEQTGRLPEARMLLMAGLMLADRTAALEDQLRVAQAELERLKYQPKPPPERVEVPVIPVEVNESMAEIAARAEALADRLDQKRRA